CWACWPRPPRPCSVDASAPYGQPAGRASDGGFQPIAPAMMVATAPNTPSQHKDTITSSIVAFIIPPAPKVRADETTNAGDDPAIVRIAGCPGKGMLPLD